MEIPGEFGGGIATREEVDELLGSLLEAYVPEADAAALILALSEAGRLDRLVRLLSWALLMHQHVSDFDPHPEPYEEEAAAREEYRAALAGRIARVLRLAYLVWRELARRGLSEPHPLTLADVVILSHVPAELEEVWRMDLPFMLPDLVSFALHRGALTQEETTVLADLNTLARPRLPALFWRTIPGPRWTRVRLPYNPPLRTTHEMETVPGCIGEYLQALDEGAGICERFPTIFRSLAAPWMGAGEVAAALALLPGQTQVSSYEVLSRLLRLVWMRYMEKIGPHLPDLPPPGAPLPRSPALSTLPVEVRTELEWLAQVAAVLLATGYAFDVTDARYTAAPWPVWTEVDDRLAAKMAPEWAGVYEGYPLAEIVDNLHGWLAEEGFIQWGDMPHGWNEEERGPRATGAWIYPPERT